MPRQNRPKSSRRSTQPPEEDGLDRLLIGWRRTEVKRGASWNVQPIASPNALKEYVCPGCPTPIAIGEAHLVAWRSDGILGDAADLDGRRHWHTHCWRVA